MTRDETMKLYLVSFGGNDTKFKESSFTTNANVKVMWL